VLPAERARGEETLHRIQVTSRSPLGSVALETEGILVDRGWLRVLGGEQMQGLTAWNALGGETEIEPVDRAFVVAQDAVGGVFALDAGAFGGEQGELWYFAPDTLEWEALERGYGDFLYWTLHGDVAGFYRNLRWPGWEDESRGASPDEAFSLQPPPWTREGKPIASAGRRLVPIAGLWGLRREIARQL